VLTCSFDKKVKIWDMDSGKFLECLQQNEERAEPKPLAIRKRGTSEIYDLDFRSRLDKGGFD
jgi:WD40 repeat protein